MNPTTQIRGGHPHDAQTASRKTRGGLGRCGWALHFDYDGLIRLRDEVAGRDAVTDSATIYTVPLESKPAYLAPRRDSTFRTPRVRIAADSGVTITQISGGTWGARSRHHYSKDQPWNSDGTRLMIDN